MNWRKKDYRKVKEPIVGVHLCIRWFHWSWRPRIYIHYWDSAMGEVRYVGIFRNQNNNYVGFNGCEK